MEMFRECGWPAFAVLGLGGLGFLVGFVALAVAIASPRAGVVLGTVALAVSCSVPAMGVGGTLIGRNKTDEALAGVGSPEDRERIRELGHHEAGQCTTLGVGVGALPLVLALAALTLGALRKKPAAAPQ
jgi:hypothetical protein